MKITQYYPLIQTKDVEHTATFYCQHFGFKPLFESDWYVHLQSTEDDSINLAVLREDHETIPTQGRGVSQGMFLTFEVEDVDAEHARLTAADVTVVQPLRSEPHGQRHTIYQDPNGIFLDLITPIPPAPEFESGYAAEALPVQ